MKKCKECGAYTFGNHQCDGMMKMIWQQQKKIKSTKPSTESSEKKLYSGGHGNGKSTDVICRYIIAMSEPTKPTKVKSKLHEIVKIKLPRLTTNTIHLADWIKEVTDKLNQ